MLKALKNAPGGAVSPGDVLITGSGRGLGLELALAFAAGGYGVILHGRDRAALARAARAVTALGARCEVRRADLRSRAGLAKLFRLFRRPGLSVLVNNAGIHCPGLPLEKVSGPAVDELIQVDFAAPVKLAARAYAAFAARGKGAIININSVCALEAHPRRAVYSAAKWGLRGFSAALRREAEGKGVRIADVYLSRVMTRPEFTHGQRADETARRIYSFFSRSRGERLVLDGRPRGRAR